jgi:hypothetical protein
MKEVAVEGFDGEVTMDIAEDGILTTLVKGRELSAGI